VGFLILWRIFLFTIWQWSVVEIEASSWDRLLACCHNLTINTLFSTEQTEKEFWRVGLPEGHEDLHKPLVLAGGPKSPKWKDKELQDNNLRYTQRPSLSSNKLLNVKFCSKSWASLSMSLGLPDRDWACKPKLLHEGSSSSSYMPTPCVADQHEQDNDTLDTVFCWLLLEIHLVRVFLTD